MQDINELDLGSVTLDSGVAEVQEMYDALDDNCARFNDNHARVLFGGKHWFIRWEARMRIMVMRKPH